MATLHTVTVKESAGDYASLNAALSGESGDLVTLDRALLINPFARVAPDVAASTGTGYTTDADHNISIVVPETERHQGVWSDTAYRIVSAVTYKSAIAIFENYTRVVGVQSYMTGTLSSVGVSATNCSDVLVDSCILRGGTHGVRFGNYGYGRITVRNCVGYVQLTAAFCDERGDGAVSRVCYFQNCTAYNTPTGFACGHGTLPTNCVSFAASTACFSSASAPAWMNGGGSGNVSSDATAPGTSPIQNALLADAHFSSTTPGSEDFHISALSVLKGVGADLSAQFTTDIAGATRTAPWDSGAFKAAATTGGTTYNEDLALGAAMGLTTTAQATFGCGLGLDASASMAPGSQASLQSALALALASALTPQASLNAQASLTLAAQAGFTHAALASLVGHVTLAGQVAMTPGAQLVAQCAQSLTTRAALTTDSQLLAQCALALLAEVRLSAGLGNTVEAAIDLAASIGLTAAARADLVGALSLDAQAAITATSQQIAEALLSLGSTASQAHAAQAQLEAALTLSAVAALLQAAASSSDRIPALIKVIAEAFTVAHVTNESFRAASVSAESFGVAHVTNETFN